MDLTRKQFLKSLLLIPFLPSILFNLSKKEEKIVGSHYDWACYDDLSYHVLIVPDELKGEAFRLWGVKFKNQEAFELEEAHTISMTAAYDEIDKL